MNNFFQFYHNLTHVIITKDLILLGWPCEAGGLLSIDTTIYQNDKIT